LEGKKVIDRIISEVSKVVVGKDEAKRIILAAMISEGHILLEGPPGIAKTLLARSFAVAMGGTFRRIQMTPDLLPADIVGSTFYEMSTSKWRVKKGPIFANIVLIDELNRTTPKTQSALLEAMQEFQVTIEGEKLTLPRPFLVLATQIPYGGAGTYPLTEVQLDRFAYRLRLDYPTWEEEVKVVSKIDEIEKFDIKPVASPKDLYSLVESARKIHVSDPVKKYIVEIVNRLRKPEEVMLGPSPRGTIWLYKGSRALAYMNGREYVIPDDVKALAPSVLSHRIRIKPEYEVEGLNPEQLLARVLEEVEVPKAEAYP